MDYKAFVSSTFVDLEHHRERVIDELQKSGFFVDPMEQWASAAQEPKDLSTRRLDGCKLCVLLVARRRGHVPDGDTLSITQQEVAEAKKRGIDILTFLLDDGVSKADWPWDATDRPAVEAWRKDLREHSVISKFKTDPATIELGPALTRWVKEKGAEVALDLYLKLVEQEHGTIQFVGLPHLKDNPNAPIKRLYVEPALAERQVSPDVDPKEWPETTPVLDVMAKERRLVVLGDPGSGKSTLVNWVTWQLAKHHHSGSSPWTERLGRLVPLPFILRNLGIGKDVTWETLLRSFLDQPIAKLLDMADLHSILEEGRAIIMLDGLDEIGNPTARRDLREAVWAAFKKYPKCRWLLASRIVGYEEVVFDAKEVSSLPYRRRDAHECAVFTSLAALRYVAPFDNARVEQFADNWFMWREDSESTWRRLAKELVEAVRADDSTTKLGRIPNLLTMMALIYRIEAQLPHGRARLYAKIAQAYLETIDKWRKLQRTTEEWTDRRRWLARVGFEMQRRRTAEDQAAQKGREILASGEEVRGWIAAAMADSGKTVGEHDAAEFVDYLAKRSGLLLPHGQECFAFLHLSFQEFFAASFLAQKMVTPAWLDGDTQRIPKGARREDLHRYANESLWHETLVFMMELLAIDQQEWLPSARDCLFGRSFKDVSRARIPSRHILLDFLFELLVGKDSGDRGALLARLVIDPQSGFERAERERALRVLCRWEMTAQERIGCHGRIAEILLMAEKTERGLIAQCLADAARELRVTRLSLVFTAVSDIGLLAELEYLRILHLGHTNVSNVEPLARLKKLQTLSLYGTKVSDVSALAELKQLRSLCLSGTNVTDLGPLAGLGQLRELSLCDLGVSDLSSLAGLRGLTMLNLFETQVSDLSPLAGLSGLTYLDLRGTKEIDLSPLAGLKNLGTIWLSEGQNVKVPASLEKVIRRV